MALLAVAATLTLLFGLIRATDAIDNHWRNRHTLKPVRRSESILWLPTGVGCRGCGWNDPPDLWLPHLCHYCAELARTKRKVQNNGR